MCSLLIGKRFATVLAVEGDLAPAVWWGAAGGVLFSGLSLWAALWLRAKLQVRTKELQESESRYRNLFESLPTPLWVIDPETFRVLEVNTAAERLFGWTRAELVAMTLPQLRTPEDLPELRAQFDRCLQGTQVAGVWRYKTKEGGVIEGEATSRVFEFRGRPTILSTLRDVTASRRAAEAVRVSEERYRKLFECSPIGLVEYDYRPTIAWLDGLQAEGVTNLALWLDSHPAEFQEAVRKVTIVSMNAAAVRLVGAKTSADVIANLPKIFTSELVAVRRAVLLAVWSGRNEAEGEVSVRALDGTLRRVFYHWWVPKIDGKLSFGHAQFALTDLTEVKSSEAALAAERERLRVTLQAMTEGVVTTDAGGVIQFMNAAAGELTGWPSAAAVGRPIADVCVLRHERTSALISPPVNAALAAGRAVDLPPQTALMRRQGPPRVVHGRCAPIHDLSKRSVGTVLVLRDMTDRMRLEAELSRASKLESVGLLAGGIAHDFNNILATIVGNLTLALMEQEVVATAGAWLREAERAALRARDLTQQLLTFAKGGDPVRSAVLLPEIVKEAAQFALHGSSVRCDFDIAEDVRPADADKGQISQVVQNLVLNAVQAMPKGGTILIKLRHDVIFEDRGLPLAPGDYLHLSICDTGPGIPAEHLARVFEPYFSTKQQGNGLGLATVYSVIRKHRGHVTVESVVGKGTTFHLWLPSARVQAEKVLETRSPFPTLQGRVLFMDDEDHIRKMTEALLTRLGLEVTAARDGDEAVRRYTEANGAGRPFDLVMMDLTVPGGKGGRDAMQEILKIDPAARGIVSSGYSSDPVMANFRSHGFCGMLAKPYRISELSRTLREVLISPRK
jgi:PAS domain S-box-containing protein